MKPCLARIRALFASAVLLATAVLPALSASCSARLPRIGLFLYDGSDTFVMELSGQIEGRLGEEFVVDRYDAAGDQIRQNEQIIALIEQCPALMIINPVDRLACGAIAEKLESEGIPVIFINREPLASDVDRSGVYYVGAEPAAQGRMQAEIAHRIFGGDYRMSNCDRNGDGIVQILILKGEQGHQDAEKRTISSIAALKRLGYKLEVLDIAVASWKRDAARKAMDAAYRSYGEQIELILCNNDDMALGAVDSLRGQHDRFVILGVDGTAAGIAAVRTGEIAGTVLNDAAAQSDAVRLLTDFILQGLPMEEFPYEIRGNRFVYIEGEIILE